MSFLRRFRSFKWNVTHVREADLNEQFPAEDFEGIQAGCNAWAREFNQSIEIEKLRGRLSAQWSAVAHDVRFLPKTADTRRYQEESSLSESPPPDGRWLFAMTRQFAKDVQQIDRKLQGRILEALAELAESPVTLKGDTIKPLTGDLKHLWRYRLGEFRIVYLPEQEKRNLTLIAFAARGAVYG